MIEKIKDWWQGKLWTCDDPDIIFVTMQYHWTARVAYTHYPGHCNAKI
jgi:hypothetical protein